VPAPTKSPDDLLLSDTTYFNGMEECPTWSDIYKIFNNEDFPMEDEDLAVYQNIKKSGIYAFVAWPMLFPYNDVVRWVFSHLDVDMDHSG
jgi:hypothetical protein